MKNNKISLSFIGVSASIFISKILGFVRDIFFAANFGTTIVADVYTFLFGTVPSLLFTSVGLALSYVNIPTLIKYDNDEDKSKRNVYISNFLSQITLYSTIISILTIILAPLIVEHMLPELSTELYKVSIVLTRLMFTTLIFICLAYATQGILQAHGHFTLSSLISIPFNILIILSLVIFKDNIKAIGLATTIGWMLQFLVQLPLLIKEKYKLKFNIDFKNADVRLNFIQFFPILIGNSIMQVCLLVDRFFSNKLSEGSSSSLYYGSFLFLTSAGIFIIAISTIAFPRLSRYSNEKNYERISSILTYIFKMISAIIIPFIIIVLFFNKEIIGLIYNRGEFDEQSVSTTSVAFLFYSLTVFGYVCQEVFNRLFYAMKKYKVPMILSIFFILLNTILTYMLYRPYGIKGITISTAITFCLYAVVMSIFVILEVGNFFNKSFFSYLLKLMIPIIIMTTIFILFKLQSFEGPIMTLFVPLGAGGVLYLVIGYFTNFAKLLKGNVD